MEFITISTRKKIASIIFILALLLALPPAFPLGEIFTDLLLNLPLATYLSSKFGLKPINSLILTYTLIPILLVYIGALIYPSDTNKTFNNQFLKLKTFFIKYINLIKKNPIHLIWLLLASIVVYKILGFYQSRVNIYLLS